MKRRTFIASVVAAAAVIVLPMRKAISTVAAIPPLRMNVPFPWVNYTSELFSIDIDRESSVPYVEFTTKSVSGDIVHKHRMGLNDTWIAPEDCIFERAEVRSDEFGTLFTITGKFDETP